jgi:DEAD/DEAH box helicase domain-containing protein
MTDIRALLDFWKHDSDTAPNFFAWRTEAPRESLAFPFPEDLPNQLRGVLSTFGIDKLYAHQHSAWMLARAGKNVILSTGTASGKTLAYNLPVLAALIENPDSRALYLFPTKSLAQDQLSTLQRFPSSIVNCPSSIYDGDTPSSQRPSIRKNARLVLSNPDMLHTGILPHHANWSEFFTHLKFIVIDEAHTYRGVFGSHVANVIRRLKRVAEFYGARPQFILASATIGNPKQLAENLIEEAVELVDNDGSARGERHFIIYNPPVTDAALGLRKSSFQESVRLAKDLLEHDIQSVVFAKTRRSVEILLTYLGTQATEHAPRPTLPITRSSLPVRGYRSGYLPSQRREIEAGLRDGSVKAVVATNALELGIDIGGLGAALIVGYPGTIASARQQAGRAGRGSAPALSILVASPNPLDQFLAHHPEYFFGSSPEHALINPDHLLILLEHLRCAMFELPFQKGDSFGKLGANMTEEFLNFLLANHEAHFADKKYYWMKDQYPAANISLRSASPQSVVLQSADEDARPVTIGTVDGESAAWMVHPGAIYMHEAQQYFVQELNLEQRVAHLIPVGLDYYTEAQKSSEIEVISEMEQAVIPGGLKAYGEIQVTTQVVGFRKVRWFTNENLGEEPLELPPSVLQTTGYWLSLSEETLNHLRESGAWTSDPNNYGSEWNRIREKVRARDSYRCQICGAEESARQHDVHHKIPFRAFFWTAKSPDLVQSQETLNSIYGRAHQMENLVTLCKTCHRKAEQNIRIKSGLAGLGFVLGNLAPLFLMCDPRDLGTHTDPAWSFTNGLPSVILYDLIPAGIGFSQKLFELHSELIQRARELVSDCPCEDGCPSCVGPGGENGIGGKFETLEILKELTR